MSRPGLFITFEGIDGAGKSSHIEGLAAAFRTQGRTVTVSREPGGTPLAEKLRAMVLGDAMDPLTESLLVFAARRDHQVTVVEPALARGAVVLCDRITDATIDSWTKVDLQYARAVTPSLDLSVGVVNLADSDPPLAQFAFGYDPVVADPRGRVISLGFTKRF